MNKVEKLQQAAAEIDESSISLADVLEQSRAFRRAFDKEHPRVKAIRDQWESGARETLERNERTIELYGREIARLQS